MPDRQAEREEIRRLLLGGRSLQMLAPRRIGKTWLMRRVAEDLAADGWITISSDVEGMRSEEQFLRDLCAKIAEQESYGKQVFHHLGQSRPRKSAHGDRWSFCLTAGTLWPANQERP
jgi:AAA+ ATPase superfamily predicted ATPase